MSGRQVSFTLAYRILSEQRPTEQLLVLQNIIKWFSKPYLPFHVSVV